MQRSTGRRGHTGTRDRRGRAAIVLAALLTVGLVTIEGSRAAFSASTSNGINQLAAGTITVSDDDGGSVLFDLPAMEPDLPEVRCINVVYTGSMTADVRLVTTASGGFAPFLTTTVEVGSGATGGAGFACTGFVPTSTQFTGTLASLGTGHMTYADGVGGFGGAVAGSTRSYRITTTMVDDNAAQGQSSTATFSWEARPA